MVVPLIENEPVAPVVPPLESMRCTTTSTSSADEAFVAARSLTG